MQFRVALTFDAEHPDRPSRPGATERTLAALEAAGAIATFFIQGRWAEANPRLAGSIAAAGHLVGNHSHYHARMPLLTTAAIGTDLRAAERAIRRTTGMDPRPWFRCPFGAGSRDPRVQAAVAAAGYREVGWHVACDDWRVHLSGPALTAAMLRGTVDHGDGAVLLLHPWTRATDRGLPDLLSGLTAAGATFVRVDDLASVP